MSIVDIDRAALAAAKNLAASQPQAKFLGNIAQSVAPIMPLVSMIPGVGPLAAAADAGASALFGGSGGGGGGGSSSLANNPYLNALQAQQLAQGDQNVATNLMNTAYGKQNSALNSTLAQYQKLLAGYKDPSFGMLQNTQYVPLSSLQTVQAPQINSLFSGNASQVPQMGSTGGYSPYYLAMLQQLSQPQINFNGYQGPGYGASSSPSSGAATPPASSQTATTMPVARYSPTNGLARYASGMAA